MANNLQYLSDFYCTQCGNLGLPVVRSARHTREPGHLKKLYCPKCHIQQNMVEIRPFGKYNYEDFQIEFQYGNFDKDGQRIDPSWKHFIAEVKQKGLIKDERKNLVDNGGDSR